LCLHWIASNVETRSIIESEVYFKINPAKQASNGIASDVNILQFKSKVTYSCCLIIYTLYHY
jgi:hypothetical protein